MLKKLDHCQGELLDEIVKFATTADIPFEDEDGGFGTLIVRPPGKGWRARPLKFQRERHTHWDRCIPVIPTPRKASRGGGGWRQV